VTALVLDAGAFIAVDRDDRAIIARLRVAATAGIALRTTGVIVAEVWREPGSRRANIARLLKAVEIQPVDERLGREAGVLLGRAGTDQAPDATIVAVAVAGDRILTSDRGDIERLVTASGRPILVVDC
jgi:predicted nucleic acid-binding protein